MNWMVEVYRFLTLEFKRDVCIRDINLKIINIFMAFMTKRIIEMV